MKNKKGFTLIELVITLAILGIVLPVIFSPVFFSFKNFDTQNEKTNIISDTRAVMDYLTREIRKSDQVTVDDNKITITIGTDLVIYEEDNGDLKKDGKVINEGIGELTIKKSDQKIEIKILARDSKNKEHSLSSIIYIR